MDIENINRKKEEILRLINQPSIEEDRKHNFFNFLDKFGKIPYLNLSCDIYNTKLYLNYGFCLCDTL